MRFGSSLLNKVITGQVITQFERITGSDRIKLTDVIREQHSHDESHHRSATPDVVVMPQNVEQVSGLVKVCNQFKIPVISFGAGTGLEGGVNAIRGGVSIDLMAMDQIIETDLDDFVGIVQPGVTREMLNDRLHNTGLWFSVDPGANASICGMAATGASGTSAVRYGTMLNNVINLEVVLSNGDILNTAGKGRRTRESGTGLNLTKLFVGSEGTLGVITEATVRLRVRPSLCSVAVCNFPCVHRAIQAVIATMQSSIPIAKIEFLDATTVASCNRYSKLSLSESPTLFLEFHADSDSDLNRQTTSVGEIFMAYGGEKFIWSQTMEDQKRLWAARSNARYAVLSTRNNAKGYSTDVCVPISALAKVVTETRKDIDQFGIIGAIVGHVGDGNFHCIFPVDKTNAEEMKVIMGLSDRIVTRALMAGGSCTGEHGIGIGKRKYLKEEFGDVGYETMKSLKKALDPNNIMNPGKKIFDKVAEERDGCE